MSNKFTKSSEKLDNYLRIFNKVLAVENLSNLKKLILSDIISFQLDGKEYRRTSKSLAKMFGKYKKGTISKAFQEMFYEGYIVTTPYNDGGSEYDLRNAVVIDIEKWVCKEDFLNQNGYSKMELKPKTKEDSNWVQTKFNGKFKEQPIEPIEIDSACINTVQEVISTEIVEINSDVQPESIDEIESQLIIDEVILNTKEQIDEFLTPKKIKWFKKYMGEEYDNVIYSFSISQLSECIYDNGIWTIRDENDDEVELQNQNGIGYYYGGLGTQITLFIPDENDGFKESIKLNDKIYEEYLVENEISFKDLTIENYHTLSQFQSPKLKL
jgi:hypothetical protein